MGKPFYDKDAVLAISVTELPAGELPRDIMWAPPGTHSICAMRNGAPFEVTVTIDEATAKAVQDALERYTAQADSGNGDRVYFDFNHDDGEASAWVKRFFWGGDNPKTGGVRAEVEWTDKGAAAVRGRAYRRFSPGFHTPTSGRITSIPANAGGLVNRAAFTLIAPITASAAVSAPIPTDEIALAEFYASRPELYDALRIEAGLGSPTEHINSVLVGVAFMDLANTISAKRRIDIDTAASVLAQAAPAAYEALMESDGDTASHPYIEKVKEVEGMTGGDWYTAEAATRLKYPELWESYKQELSGLSAEELADLI